MDVSDAQLKDAPKFARDENFDMGDRDRDLRIYDYYDAAPYWF